MRHLKFLMLGTAVALLGVGVQAQQTAQPSATATVSDTQGTELGQVTLTDTASGQVLVSIDLSGVAPGGHAIHLHETGDCSADDFTSAGGHIAGDAEHGVLVENGPHPGDMPNVTVGDDGTLKTDVFLADLPIDDMIRDDDGAAFIMHAGQDDYTSQPSGDAGDRLACGAFDTAN